MELNNYYYVLDADGNPIVEPDVLAWSRWTSENFQATIVAKSHPVDEVEVSTIFTGVNHGLIYGLTVPLLFETMIFGGDHDLAQWRYATRARALAHHDQIVAALRAGECPPNVTEGDEE